MKYSLSTYIISTLIDVYNYMLTCVSWLEIIMCELQNEHLVIYIFRLYCLLSCEMLVG